MTDNLTIFGVDYTGVTGIKATQTNDGELTYIRPSGTLSVTQNGTVDVTQYASASVNVAASSNDFVVTLTYNDQTELWEPDCTYAEAYAAYSDGKTVAFAVQDVFSENEEFTTCDGLYIAEIPGFAFAVNQQETSLDGQGNDQMSTMFYLQALTANGVVSIDTGKYWNVFDTNAAPSDVAQGKKFYNHQGRQVGTYVAPTARTASDVTVSGDTVTVPAGAYSSQVTKSVASGTAGTPTATKGAVSNHAVSVTPSVTNSTGYISGGTKTGTAVSVSASELVSGTYTVSASGSHDVTNYESASVAAGSASAPSTISGTSATVSTGTNTLTLSKTVSVTPTVSAGYVSSGTATNSAVSLTASVTTQAAQTIYPSTSDQTIAASRYLTGAQTIKGVAVANLTAANIKSGVTVTVGDSADADRIMSVTGTYSGGSSKNVQVAQSTTRVASTSYTKTASLTCSVSGKYDVYWDCFRSSTSGTNGSQLYIGGSAYGDANTTWASTSVNTQTNHLTNVQINANQEVAVYVRSRGTSYYASCGQLTIVQTA